RTCSSGIATTPADAVPALPPISTPPISTWPRDSEGGKRTDERRPTGRAAVRESGTSPPTCTPARGLRTVLQTGLTTRECPVKMRSEEHTSELQSRFDLVCRL